MNQSDVSEKFFHVESKKLCRSAKGIYVAAQEADRGGDEELAFIFYMRYITIIKSLQKKADFRSKQTELSALFGGNDCLRNALNTAEALRRSLISRFNERDNPKRTPSTETLPAINSQQNGSSNKSRSPISVPDLSQNDSCRGFVSTKELFRIIEDGQNNVLIIDCRPENDFNESKLKYIHCVNVPEEIIRNGISAGTIQSQLSTESKALWAYRSIKEDIILMDWDSETNHLNAPISTLKNILLHWDPDVHYKNPILILNGGYGGFMDFYPTLTTNSRNRRSRTHFESEIDINLDDIEYSNIHEVPMRDERIFHQLNDVPIVDRSSKAAAEKLYSEELQQKREKLLDEQIDNEQNLLDKIMELKNENIQKYDGDVTKLEEARLNINNERIELEDKQDELEQLKLKYDRLQQQLQAEQAAHEQFRNSVDSTMNAEIEKRIAEKEATENELRIKRKREAEDIEKKQRESEMVARARLTKPKLPAFDRGAKPQRIIRDDDNVIRNFSGQGHASGPGLTGLVNLYNNCYMNNIVQCLSNTTDLAEYFLSDRYKPHINRASETHGRIVEELAALFKEIWCKQFAHIASIDFRNTVGHYHAMFSGPDHQDSHEFLRILIDWMHLDLETLSPEIPRGSLTAADKAWLTFVKNKESAIFRLFYGQFKSTLKCVECKCESATYDCFSDLSLQVPSVSREVTSTDIDKCLDNFFYGEYIDDWECPKCKEKRRAIKKLDISKLPKILVIHFKRFQVDLNGCGMLVNSSKKQINISFPLVGLNMSKHIAPSAKAINQTKQLYNLYGVSNHYGTLTAGHYTAFCKSRVLQKWFKFDDKKVTQLDPSGIQSSAAYILFYTNDSSLLLS
ncbi:hypothetical protein HA402_007632 [Bradysia odoriphaga]|nr:hypothetical protein HA402_007632 [Bradysia odoriphaga]